MSIVFTLEFLQLRNWTFVQIMNHNSFSFIWMRTVPPFTSIQKVDFLLPVGFLALHVYSPESSNLAWRIVRVFFLPILIPSLVQSTSGVGKPLKEQLNWRGKLYVTDWLMSQGLISGGPGRGIKKHSSKKVKKKKKKTENEKSNWKRISNLTFTCNSNLKSCFTFPFTVLRTACILTSVSISHLFNGELVRDIK